MSFISPKSRALLLIMLMIGALTLLATGFGSLEFQKGRAIRFVTLVEEAEESAEVSAEPEEEQPSQIVDPATVSVMITILLYVVFPIALFITLMSRSGRAWLWQEVVRNLVAVLFFLVVIRFLAQLNLEQTARQEGAQAILLPLDGMPPAFVAAVSFSISLILAMIVGTLYLRWRMRPRPAAAVSSSAREAIAEIKSGGELRNVILRCYHDMLNAVRETVGVQRMEHVTPREFEDHLIQLGLPSADVQQLTRLFEQVRYGESADNAITRQRALHCLKRIVNAIEVTA